MSMICTVCQKKMDLEILHSNAGYYIGRVCNCGPYSNESWYMKTRGEAEKTLKFFQDQDDSSGEDNG